MTNTKQQTNENLTLHFKVKDFKAWRTGYKRLIPLTQVRLYVVGASIPPVSRFCVDCLA
jgi:hypothetical protein